MAQGPLSRCTDLIKFDETLLTILPNEADQLLQPHAHPTAISAIYGLRAAVISSTDGFIKVQKRFVQTGKKPIRNTLKSVSMGQNSWNRFRVLQDIDSNGSELCDACELGNTRHDPISKKSKHQATEALEIVKMNIQRPFPIIGACGTNLNVKCLDRYSGYVKTEFIQDNRSETVRACFERYRARMERRMGKKIKVIRCDSGTEFGGEFLSHFEG